MSDVEAIKQFTVDVRGARASGKSTMIEAMAKGLNQYGYSVSTVVVSHDTEKEITGKNYPLFDQTPRAKVKIRELSEE